MCWKLNYDARYIVKVRQHCCHHRTDCLLGKDNRHGEVQCVAMIQQQFARYKSQARTYSFKTLMPISRFPTLLVPTILQSHRSLWERGWYVTSTCSLDAQDISVGRDKQKLDNVQSWTTLFSNDSYYCIIRDICC